MPWWTGIEHDALRLDRRRLNIVRTGRRLSGKGRLRLGWVPDDPWSHGKCALKLLQYHAAGLPVVANPVGVQSQIVRPGINGFLATTEEDWIGAVRALASDAELRRRLGDAGRLQVRNSYSVDVGGAAWVELIGRLEAGAA